MKQTLRDLAEKLGCRLLGDGSITVTSVSSLQSATSGSLVFVEDAQYLDAVLRSSAAAVIAGDFAAGNKASKPILISPQPRLIFARAAKLLRDPDRNREIHSTAIVPASAKIGKNVAIGARAILGEHVKVGDETTIGPGSAIGNDTIIGSHCRLDANVIIYPGTTLGDRIVVQAGAVLGGEGFGYVRDSQTGHYERGTKIDNLVHIGHNVQIGQDVVIAAQTGLSGSVTIEDNVIMGGQVGIADHVRVEAGAILGAQSGIPTKKIIRGKGVVFWGTPARPIREYLKELAFLSRSAKKDR